MPTLLFLLAAAPVTPSVPSQEQLIPWIVSVLFAIITGFGGWLLKALIPAIKELREGIRALEDKVSNMEDEHRKGHAAMTQAMLVLTFKVHNPAADVSDEAKQIQYSPDERKR